ncbi:MAG: DOMON-like domain-containing protein [Zoogloeaceae bacterium]|jgi:hypothetical protein|nr:DOMON-like domain-containing protein [Zoogloeaceae bacterium]
MTPIRFSATLSPHPDFPAPDVAVDVAGIWEDADLRLEYTLRGKLSAFLFPAPGQELDPGRLWAHSCCEVFLATADSCAYREYNFSPNGQWAVFDFSDYRQRAESTPALAAPRTQWQHTPAALHLCLELPAAALPAAPLRLALAVVLETRAGRLAYYALRHPPGAPDFHHPSCFTFHLFLT